MATTGTDIQQATTHSPWSNIVNIFVAPTESFAAIRSAPSSLFPLLVLILANTGIFIWYYSVVDFPWLVDQLVTQMGEMPKDQEHSAKEQLQSIGNTGMIITSVISLTVMILVMNLLQAAYLMLVSSIVVASSEYRFKHWFSLSCWVSLVGLASVLVTVINIFLSKDGHIDLHKINSLTLSNLGLDGAGNSGLKSLFDFLNLPLFWSLALLTVAFKQWTQSSYTKASLIIFTPYIIIIAIWVGIAIS